MQGCHKLSIYNYFLKPNLWSMVKPSAVEQEKQYACPGFGRSRHRFLFLLVPEWSEPCSYFKIFMGWGVGEEVSCLWVILPFARPAMSQRMCPIPGLTVAELEGPSESLLVFDAWIWSLFMTCPATSRALTDHHDLSTWITAVASWLVSLLQPLPHFGLFPIW